MFQSYQSSLNLLNFRVGRSEVLNVFLIRLIA